MTKKKEAVSEQGRGETGEIIIHPLAKAPEPFLEEINTVRLEGRYFAFDPKRANTKPARQEFKDGERKLEIVVHPEYWHPSVLAYRILQHVFLKITKEGKPFPDGVSFSYREIGRLIGRDIFGGKDVREIERAIKQLQSTEVIETTIDEKEGRTRRTRKISYSLVITTGIITEGTSGNGRLQAVALQIHPLIMESMRRDHFIILNWPTIAELPPLSAMWYSRRHSRRNSSRPSDRMRSISPSIARLSVSATARRPVVRRPSASFWTAVRQSHDKRVRRCLLRYQRLSARRFSISISAGQRPVRLLTETGSQSARRGIVTLAKNSRFPSRFGLATSVLRY